MKPKPSMIVVGAGQAGGWAAQTMRTEGFQGRIILVGEETHLPYERPPLSKGLLAGEGAPEQCYLQDRVHYRKRDIELRLGTKATVLDLESRQVHLSNGETLDYDKLLLATGSRVRKLDVSGGKLANIFYLRTIEDMLLIRSRLKPGADLVIVGGGYIGLEVAATACGRGCNVTVVERERTVMNRVVAPEVGAFFAEVHEEQGVNLQFGGSVARFEGQRRVERVVCDDGTVIPADVVIIGVGARPNDELAAVAGLVVDDGIVIDEYGQTVDQHVFAAGDVANHPNAVLGRHVRLESWQNAQNQAITVAQTMCGNRTPYRDVPWFWSDQFNLTLQIVGLATDWDSLVYRGNVEEQKFTVFYLRDGAVVAANAVNNPRDIHFARQLVAEKRRISPGVLSDLQVPLKKLF